MTIRLIKNDIDGIIDGIENVLHKSIHKFKPQIYIYGSRVEPNKKGGDIDLILVVDDAYLEEVESLKLKLLVSIKNNIGDRKIDLSLASSFKVSKDPFFKKSYGKIRTSQVLERKY